MMHRLAWSVFVAHGALALTGCTNGDGAADDVVISAAAATARGAQGNPKIAPPNSRPHGLSYSEWGAAWWTWALETPAAQHPLLDPTGEDCANNQTGHVWFLGGVFASEPEAETTVLTRRCTIPVGTALLFPLLNSFSGFAPGDPPNENSEAFQRQRARCVEEDPSLSAEIDGRPVQNPEGYLEQSTVFSVTLPEDNIVGVPELGGLTVFPSVDEGYYLFLQPLSAGQHTIHFTADSEACGVHLDVTYLITVAPRRGR